MRRSANQSTENLEYISIIMFTLLLQLTGHLNMASSRKALSSAQVLEEIFRDASSDSESSSDSISESSIPDDVQSTDRSGNCFFLS